MRYADDTRNHDESAQNWSGEPYADDIGPQGDALILELRRLRQALDGERRDSRPSPAPPGRGEARKRQAPRKPQQQTRAARRRKSKVKLALDICLKPFGRKDPVQAEAVGSVSAEPVRHPSYRPSPP